MITGQWCPAVTCRNCGVQLFQHNGKSDEGAYAPGSSEMVLTRPDHPLPKPEAGRYHLVRFIRSNALLDVFGDVTAQRAVLRSTLFRL